MVTVGIYLVWHGPMSLGRPYGPGRASGQPWTIILGVLSYGMVSVWSGSRISWSQSPGRISSPFPCSPRSFIEMVSADSVMTNRVKE